MRKQSFSLTEVLVGSFILAVTFGSLLASFSTARNYTFRGNKRLIAINIARDTLDTFYPQLGEDTWRAGEMFDPAGSPYALGAINVEGVTYTRAYSVINLGKDYRQVTVTVQYP